MPDVIIRSVERSGKPQTRITVRAPHDGYVSKLDVRTGAQVTATQPLFELASLDPVWIVIDYPQSQASLLRVGSQVTATTSSWPGTTFQGTVSELLPDLEATTRTLKARVVLNNPQHQLKPGMYLNVELAEAQQGARGADYPGRGINRNRHQQPGADRRRRGAFPSSRGDGGTNAGWSGRGDFRP